MSERKICVRARKKSKNASEAEEGPKDGEVDCVRALRGAAAVARMARARQREEGEAAASELASEWSEDERLLAALECFSFCSSLTVSGTFS